MLEFIKTFFVSTQEIYVKSINDKQELRENNIPEFEYFSNPLRTGDLKAEKSVCDICSLQTDYAFRENGGPDGEDKELIICPDCIVSGKAVDEFDIVLEKDVETILSSEKLDVLSKNTPNIVTWQEMYWPDCCGDYSQFVDYVGWKEIDPIKNNLKKDITSIKKNWNLSQKDLEDSLSNSGDLQGYLFACKKCSQYQLKIDAS